MAELRQIPTHLLAGPLGAGKTTVLRHLLAVKPPSERWAVLVNEFGAVGIDAALIGRQDGVDLAEIPGGCLCCVNGLPFQVGLGRLLRRARPDRLLIETSGLGHPASLLKQLQGSPWSQVLHLHHLLMVLDAQALEEGRALPATQADALALADLLILNKSANLDEAARLQVCAGLPERPMIWCEQGRIPWPLPVGRKQPSPTEPAVASAKFPEDQRMAGRVWLDPQQWECHVHHAQGWHSIGWLIHPARRFDQTRLEQWLGALPYARAKGVLQTESGWRRLNSVQHEDPLWEAGEPASANRMELLFTVAPAAKELDEGLKAASLSD